ncbi:MAG: hypothetical protein RRZ64_08975 [Rikenellaceae bacterium]
MREYPAFIIDRSKRSEASKYKYDYVVCTDKEVGFIAKVYKLPKSTWSDFDKMIDAMPKDVADIKYCTHLSHDSALVLEVVKYLYEPLYNKSRLKPLLKKAIKAYIFGEADFIHGDGSEMDLQINAVQDVLDIAFSQEPHLVEMNGREATDLFFTTLQEAICSLKLLKLLKPTTDSK